MHLLLLLLPAALLLAACGEDCPTPPQPAAAVEIVGLHGIRPGPDGDPCELAPGTAPAALFDIGMALTYPKPVGQRFLVGVESRNGGDGGALLDALEVEVTGPESLRALIPLTSHPLALTLAPAGDAGDTASLAAELLGPEQAAQLVASGPLATVGASLPVELVVTLTGPTGRSTSAALTVELCNRCLDLQPGSEFPDICPGGGDILGCGFAQPDAFVCRP